LPTDRQIKTFLLCSDCEDILSNGGETWVCPKLAWVDRRFELFDLLYTGGGYRADGEKEILFFAADNSEIDIEKIAHFALGIFWKASIHSWKGGLTEPMIDLDGHEEEIRLWLRGEGPFPKDVTMSVGVSRPERAQLTIGQPVEIPMHGLRRIWRRYQLSLVGTMFSINVGKSIPIEDYLYSFYRNPCVLMSDNVTGILERKLAEHFAESRKTKAYQRYKARSIKPDHE
jgi:hypothetical protein